MNKFVFVYGSLKKGFYNHSLLSSSRLIGVAKTLEKYCMIDMGSFPGVSITEEVSVISGEVYEVSEEEFERLDMLEGYPSFYNRKKVKVIIGYAEMEVWMYYLNNSRDWSKNFALKSGVWKEGEYSTEDFVRID